MWLPGGLELHSITDPLQNGLPRLPVDDQDALLGARLLGTTKLGIVIS